MGISMVKWTTPDPCLMLSESDSMLCTSFEFCEGIKSYTFFEHIDLQSQSIYDEIKYCKRGLHILEGGASGCK